MALELLCPDMVIYLFKHRNSLLTPIGFHSAPAKPGVPGTGPCPSDAKTKSDSPSHGGAYALLKETPCKAATCYRFPSSESILRLFY